MHTLRHRPERAAMTHSLHARQPPAFAEVVADVVVAETSPAPFTQPGVCVCVCVCVCAHVKVGGLFARLPLLGFLYLCASHITIASATTHVCSLHAHRLF